MKYCADACLSGYTISSPVCTAPSGDDLYTVLMNTKANVSFRSNSFVFTSTALVPSY